ncbi:MAG: type II and III secretion system protein [Bryobacterales bacterium]|nr:type II and III secretion system protein [Bryobacteraceae bacterium]MDW8129881.1 type II and III secretion system protein [Bryobacterales bacterium]
MLLRALLLCVGLACRLPAEIPTRNLYREARKAELEGDEARALLLYSLAAARQPNHPVYWSRARELKARLAAQNARPAAALAGESLPALSEADWLEARRLQPPPALELPAGPRDFQLEGDARQQFEQLARACSLELVFDADYRPGARSRTHLSETDCLGALRQLEMATGSFVVPLSPRLILIAQDTPPKRAELEPHIAVTIPVPEPVTVQELQEIGRAVQQTMEIVKMGFDSQRRLVLLRDRISKVRPAELLFRQLLEHRAQVVLELELLEVDRTSLASYGFQWPGDFPFYNFARLGRSLAQLPTAGATRGFLFGGGRTLFGIGVGDAQVLARLTETSGHTLLRAQLRSLAGQPASFHVGDQYPVMTAGYFGYTYGLPVYTPPPTLQFADLGLVLKYTPYVHGMDEVTLELEAEFKLLAGQSVNGIPFISNRRVASKVRLRAGEWAVVAGLLSASEARTIRGLAGLARLPVLGPLFRQREVVRDSAEVLLLLKPHVVSPPPTELATAPIWVGSEGRPRAPLVRSVR